MAAFISDYVWPLALMVAESVLLLIVLLIVVAYVLLADRKIWAAVQIRRGPNVVGPWGLFQSFADLIKFVLKEPVIPAGARKRWAHWSVVSVAASYNGRGRLPTSDMSPNNTFSNWGNSSRLVFLRNSPTLVTRGSLLILKKVGSFFLSSLY